MARPKSLSAARGKFEQRTLDLDSGFHVDGMLVSRRQRSALRLAALVLVVLGSFWIASLAPTDSPGAPAVLQHSQCERVLVYRFDSANGFGSEFGIYLRVAALSSTLGYTIISDSRNWVYGELIHFFEPDRLNCDLEPGILDGWSYPFGFWGWTIFPRISLPREYKKLVLLDAIVRETSTDLEEMRRLKEREQLYAVDVSRMTLPYGESVPDGLRRAFHEQVEALERIWVPSARVQKDVDVLRARTGLDEPGRIRPVIALQIRLGDKKREQQDIRDAGSHISFGDMRVYLKAAKEALDRLYDPSLTRQPFLRPGHGERPPLLVVMTVERHVVQDLQRLDTAGTFEIIQSPIAELFSEQETAEYHRVLGEGWTQEKFTAASEHLRLALTRSLIAELTVYSRYADAFVVSGNSNMGRIALLLAGEEGALGLPGRRHEGGRVRSIDVPFYPTTFRMFSFPP